MLCPFVQILPLRDQELKMVEAGKELVERVLWPIRILDQADFEPGARLEETRVALTFIVRLILTADRQIQELAVPADASLQIRDREGRGQVTRNRCHGYESANRRDLALVYLSFSDE